MFSPLALLQERQCQPIYDALDTGSYKAALAHANKLLKKQPNFPLASSLKAIALARSGRRDEALATCEEVIKAKPTDLSVLNALSFVMGSLGRSEDLVDLYDNACKASPNHEELAGQTFLKMARAGMYQRQQQLSFRMHKTFKQDQYFWWCMQAYSLQARDPSQQGAALALPLAERMISKQVESKPLSASSLDTIFLYAKILSKQGKTEAALKLLEEGVGDEVCGKSLGLEIMRTDLRRQLGAWEKIRQEARQKLESGDKNWTHLLAFVDASIKLDKEGSTSSRSEEASQLLQDLSDKADSRDRGLRLAQLELLKQCSAESINLSKGDKDDEILALCKSYFDTFCEKAACYEDLMSYASILSANAQSAFREHIGSEASSPKSERELRRMINVAKLRRALQSDDGEAEQLELARSYLTFYLQALPLGKDLPETEMQPADDFALLGAQALVSAHAKSGLSDPLYEAVACLEHAVSKSKKNYQLRVFLIRLYILLGCFPLAFQHYNLLGVKNIQLDTVSHYVLDRISTFSLAPSGDRTVQSAIGDALDIYRSNAHEVPEVIAKAYRFETYSRIEEFVDFGERVDRSVNRQILRLELARADLSVGEAAELESARGIVEEVRTALKKGQLFDQRDYTVLPSYQPRTQAGIEKQLATGPRTGDGWVRAMLDVVAAPFDVEDSGSPAPSDSTPDADLTPQEAGLHAAARAVRRILSGQQTQAELERFFKDRQLELEQSQNQNLPWQTLHSGSIALEGFALLEAALKRANISKETKAALESAHSEASTVLRSIASTLLERSKHVKSPETQTAHFEACKTFSSAWSAAAGAAHERNGAESESESERLVKSALNRIAEEQARAMAGLAEGIRRRVK